MRFPLVEGLAAMEKVHEGQCFQIFEEELEAERFVIHFLVVDPILWEKMVEGHPGCPEHRLLPNSHASLQIEGIEREMAKVSLMQFGL